MHHSGSEEVFLIIGAALENGIVTFTTIKELVGGDGVPVFIDIYPRKGVEKNAEVDEGSGENG